VNDNSPVGFSMSKPRAPRSDKARSPHLVMASHDRTRACSPTSGSQIAATWETSNRSMLAWAIGGVIAIAACDQLRANSPRLLTDKGGE